MTVGEIHTCEEPSIVFFDNRSIVELNFTIHNYDRPAAFFLRKGQYFKSLKGAPEIFELGHGIDYNHYRYLFSHLVGTGHVLIDEDDFNPDLDKSLKDWRMLNPFNATEDELNILFDTNEALENQIDLTAPVSQWMPSYQQVNEITRTKIDHSLHQWKTHKLIIHAKYLLFFAGKSIQETAHELQFKDPAYFGRFFKRNTTKTPGEFIDEHTNRPSRYVLLNQLNELIETHFMENHQVRFYAEKLHMSPKSLSRNVLNNYGLSAKHLINQRLIQEAEKLLNEGVKKSDISFMLGFKEVSHFSAFSKTQRLRVSPKSTIN